MALQWQNETSQLWQARFQDLFTHNTATTSTQHVRLAT